MTEGPVDDHRYAPEGLAIPAASVATQIRLAGQRLHRLALGCFTEPCRRCAYAYRVRPLARDARFLLLNPSSLGDE